MTKEKNISEHLRHSLLFLFVSGKNQNQALAAIREAYGNKAISERSLYRWYERFSNGDNSLNDEDRSGRPISFNDEQLRELVEENHRLTTRELAEQMNVASNKTIANHLHLLGFKSKFGVWVPHKLTKKNIKKRLKICDELLKKHKDGVFLDSIVTDDEKWILYSNVKRKKQWVKSRSKAKSTAKAGLHPKKVLISVFWDSEGIVYYEFLLPNQTINAVYYDEQLDRLKKGLDEKRPHKTSINFLHDNARPHGNFSLMLFSVMKLFSC
uniref:Mos1 transposase HTH domain-containing protein n=1 Tax=Ditylenchus dipsaci TaxID=166011 RepID=A0A915DPD1_9BILA